MPLLQNSCKINERQYGAPSNGSRNKTLMKTKNLVTLGSKERLHNPKIKREIRRNLCRLMRKIGAEENMLPKIMKIVVHKDLKMSSYCLEERSNLRPISCLNFFRTV